MESDQAVYSALRESGVPGTWHAWPEGGAPSLPWFTYELEEGGEVFADGSNYSALPIYRASLYERVQDPDVQKAFESAVGSIGPYTREVYPIDSEGCVMTTYTFTYTGGING